MKYAVIIIVVIACLLLIYSYQSEKTFKYINDIKFQGLKMESKMGQETISHDPNCSTIMIWFHPECEHCQYQLDIINNNIERLPAVRFLFITDEKNFFKDKYLIKWPDLVKSSYAIFGIIERSRFINEFGPVITPSLLFFDREGILKERLLGEVKIEKIIQMINKHPVPEQKMSGSN